MSVECDMIQAAIPQFVDGQMDESKRASVLDHASGCEACARALEFQIRLRGAIECGPLAPPSEGFFDSVLERVHLRMDAAESARAGWRRRLEALRGYWESAQRGLSIAAACLLLLAGGLATRSVIESSMGSAPRRASSAVATPFEASLGAELVPTTLPTPAAAWGARVPGAPSHEAERSATRDAATRRARLSRSQMRLLAAPR